MKKIIFALATVAIILIASCISNPTNNVVSSTTDSITVRIITPEYFIQKANIVKDGDLLWDYSMYEFGTGTRWTEWVKLNPILQQPGRVWFDKASGHWIALLKINEKLINPQPVRYEFGVKEITIYSTTEVPVYDYTYLWLLIPFIFLLLLVIYSLISANKKKKQSMENLYETIQKDGNKINSLNKELETVKNQLPVKAPEIANEEWLKNNFSVGNPIPEDDPEVAANTISRTSGKKPDLIVQAKVSTAGKAINMEFSHDRKATTGLKDVVVYLGWNWDKVKKIWNEVGMWAGSCSNGFEANPDNVVKGQLFTKIELVDQKRHPVLFTGENVPNGAKYPALVKSLVLKYHDINIADIKKAGAGVIVPKSLK